MYIWMDIYIYLCITMETVSCPILFVSCYMKKYSV